MWRLLHLVGFRLLPPPSRWRLCAHVKDRWGSKRDLVIFVDNCYGEFVEDREPCHVGADLVAGSLIKNPGGTLAKSGEEDGPLFWSHRIPRRAVEVCVLFPIFDVSVYYSTRKLCVPSKFSFLFEIFFKVFLVNWKEPFSPIQTLKKLGTCVGIIVKIRRLRCSFGRLFSIHNSVYKM